MLIDPIQTGSSSWCEPVQNISKPAQVQISFTAAHILKQSISDSYVWQPLKTENMFLRSKRQNLF